MHVTSELRHHHLVKPRNHALHNGRQAKEREREVHAQDVTNFGGACRTNVLQFRDCEDGADLILHVEVQWHARAPRVAIAAQEVRLRGDAPVCIGLGVGEEGDGRVAQVLEAHAHVGNVGPGVTDCAELPVENCERAAGHCKLLQFVMV